MLWKLITDSSPNHLENQHELGIPANMKELDGLRISYGSSLAHSFQHLAHSHKLDLLAHKKCSMLDS
jgi:hypothetical protein